MRHLSGKWIQNSYACRSYELRDQPMFQQDTPGNGKPGLELGFPANSEHAPGQASDHLDLLNSLTTYG